jgi:phosphoribosylamine--glycine ligase
MRVIVLGSGGREHALAWALARSPLASEVVCAPGSAGIARDVPIRAVDPRDSGAVVGVARAARADLVVVGPEAPLVAGLADDLRAAGIPTLGPGREAARLEGSKVFAKGFMSRRRIPTAPYRVFDDPDEAEAWAARRGGPIVVKADGLTGAKGVTVCDGPAEARQAIREAMRERRFGDAGSRVLLEDRLVGEEVSYYVLSDGERFVPLAAAQDHKRALDGDRGENTGGMGAYSPVPVLTPETEAAVTERIVRPTLAGMSEEGVPYRGILFVGLMIVKGDPFVLEYNVRLGDPETQAILFRLESDLLPALRDAAEGGLRGAERVRFGRAAVCVVLASKGYPRSYPTGLRIDGLGDLDALPDVKVFHAGTEAQDGTWRTAGGRVLGVTGRGATIEEARRRAYGAIERIRFEGMHYRADVALRAATSSAAS